MSSYLVLAVLSNYLEFRTETWVAPIHDGGLTIGDIRYAKYKVAVVVAVGVGVVIDASFSSCVPSILVSFLQRLLSFTKAVLHSGGGLSSF